MSVKPGPSEQQKPEPSGEPARPFADFMRLSAWLCIAGGIVICLLAFSSFLAPGFWFTDNMSFFHRQFLAAAVGGLVGSLLTSAAAGGLGRAFVKGQLVLLITIVTLLSLLISRTQEVSTPTNSVAIDQAAAGPGLRLMSANIEGLSLSDPDFVSFIERTDPDVLLIEELQWDYQVHRNKALQSDHRKALGAAYPHHLALGDLGDVALFSKYPIVEDETTIVHGIPPEGTNAHYVANRELVAATLDLKGQRVRVFALHPESPRSSIRWTNRQDYYDALSEALAQETQPNKLPTIVMGDWNTSPWSGVLLKFLKDHDLRVTFPDGVPSTTRFFYDYRLHWIFGAIVDHIAVSNDITVNAVKLGPDIGSDHLPLIADIQLAESTE
ncbi:MAG: endonuclease/exonuclease/phosphatase family protein [Rhodobacteraceae bacterium]|nr:endonuclease/exonuclease/phosphatase family protein [Paracoccaceae bacterium]